MYGAEDPDGEKRSLLHSGVARWLIAGGIALTITTSLFIMMTRLIDGSFILDRMLRVFPLTQTPLVDPCEEWQARQDFVPVEGVVGYYAANDFVPLADAEITGEHRRGEGQRVEVSQAGVFSFLTGFPDERPASCSAPLAPGALAKKLIIHAPGCMRREISVTRSWIPHRVLLECDRGE